MEHVHAPANHPALPGGPPMAQPREAIALEHVAVCEAGLASCGPASVPEGGALAAALELAASLAAVGRLHAAN